MTGFWLQLRMAERALLVPLLHQHPHVDQPLARKGLLMRKCMLHFITRLHSFTMRRLHTVLLPACLKVPGLRGS